MSKQRKMTDPEHLARAERLREIHNTYLERESALGRKKPNYTAMAARVGWTQPMLSSYLLEYAPIGAKAAVKLASIYGVHAEDIMPELKREASHQLLGEFATASQRLLGADVAPEIKANFEELQRRTIALLNGAQRMGAMAAHASY